MDGATRTPILYSTDTLMDTRPFPLFGVSDVGHVIKAFETL